MKNRYYVYYLLATVILSAVAFWGIYAPSHTTLLTTSAPTHPSTQEQTTIATSSVSSAYDIFIPVQASSTALEAMASFEESSQHRFTYTGHDYPGLGFFVDSINGKANANGLYWFLYVNGESSDTGASQTLLHPGDVVEWRYERSH
jgi:hypothetical protein